MPQQAITLETRAADAEMLDAVNDLLDALGCQPITTSGSDSIPARIVAMAQCLRRSAAGDSSRRMALADLAGSAAGCPQPDYKRLHAQAVHVAKSSGIPYTEAYSRVLNSSP